MVFFLFYYSVVTCIWLIVNIVAQHVKPPVGVGTPYLSTATLFSSQLPTDATQEVTHDGVCVHCQPRERPRRGSRLQLGGQMWAPGK